MNPTNPLSTHDIGARAEQLAAEFLVDHSYRILMRNFFYKKVGEVDIIAMDHNTLVFVEVRYRSNSRFSPPEASLSSHKIRRIRRTAEAWLVCTRTKDVPIRFDLVAMELHSGKIEIRHLKNAF